MIWSIIEAIRMLRILANEITDPEDGEERQAGPVLLCEAKEAAA